MHTIGAFGACREQESPLSRYIRTIFSVRLGFMNALLSLVMVGALALLKSSRPELDLLRLTVASAAKLVYAVVSVNIHWLFVNALFSRWRLGRIVAALLTVMLLWLLYAYHYTTNFSFDYAVMRDNVREIFFSDSVSVITGRIGTPFIAALIAILAVLSIAEWRRQVLSRQTQTAPLMPKALFWGALYALCILLPVPSHDEGVLFGKSIYRYYADEAVVASYERGSFPLVKEGPPAGALPAAERPNIFVILMESFNGFMPEARNEQGAEYTPFFNSLIPQGVYVERFYGNSVQTSKGHFAVFFSVVPSIRGKVYTDYPRTSFHSLPAALSAAGYETLFFQAYKDLSFDNTRPFLSRNGFRHVETVASFMTPGDEPLVWGWGLQDDAVYRKFFAYLDTLEEKGEGRRPYFGAIATISAHGEFDQVPRHLRMLYPDPKDRQERFANALHASDAFLETFFAELRKRPYLANSIVVITGDHSVPNGRHGLYCGESAAYEEFFRVPLLVLWPGHLAPERIIDLPFSQIDIAPTLAELAGIPLPRHHFEGRSLFAERRAEPVYLVQPYNGQFLSVVEYPFKLTRHLAGETVTLFDLRADPMEERDLALAPAFAAIRERLERSLSFIFLNQELIRRDEVWRE